ncbi:hypothetical protein BC831DRAFT_482178 [Entophlyctis helioformis]|nr:hypothetical protein BC831DRAFT_482178 [Entophlyctis helioformis]
MLNHYGSVHGGVHPFVRHTAPASPASASASLQTSSKLTLCTPPTQLGDMCTSIALSAVHPGSTNSVSAAITIEYVDAAKQGDTLYIVNKVNKASGRLAYITYEILCSKTGSDEERRIVATGSHTKYVLKNKM